MTNTPYTLADLTVDYLERLGVEYVFGVPGGHIAALYEALARSEKRGGPRAILARHETGAAHMADGYARETGRLGVCCATTGPGVTNLITGVASAYCDHTPLLVVTAQTALPYFGAGAFQESSPDGIDAAGMLGRCTRYNATVTHPRQFEQKLASALRHALQGPRGPVHLSVPVDVYRTPAPSAPAYPRLPELLARPGAFIDREAMNQLWRDIETTLRQGQRIAILAGHACTGAASAILRFAEAVEAAVVTTHRGKRWIDAYHPLAFGVFGYAGHDSARRALTDDSVGLILAAGTALGQWTTSNWDTALLSDRLVHIHSAGEYFSRSPMARLHVLGVVKEIFEELADRAETLPRDARTASALAGADRRAVPAQIEIRTAEGYRSDAVPIHPQRLIFELMRRFPAETRFLVDTSCWLPWTLHYFFPAKPENYRLSSELAAMGWAIGAAVGTALAAPHPVVCLTGDGCFLMNGQEITVAVEQGLPVIFIILNDGGFGMVKHRHRQVVEEPLEFGFRRVDFSLMAQALGARGYAIRTPAEFDALDMAELCRRSGPTVLDVYIDSEATPPMGMY